MTEALEGVIAELLSEHRRVSDSRQVFLIASDGTTDREVKCNSAGQLEVSTMAGGGASHVDSDPFSVGTGLGTPAMGLHESSPTAVTAGDAGVFAMTSLRAQHAFLVNNSGLQVGTASNPFVVDTRAVQTESGSLAGKFYNLIAGDDGTDAHPLQLSAAGDLKVTLDGEAVALAVGTLATVTNIVDATTLTSDATWTDGIDTDGLAVRLLRMRNTSNTVLEVAYNNSPTATSGSSIADYIGPGESVLLDFRANNLELGVDVKVRRFDGTPAYGYFIATGYYVA